MIDSSNMTSSSHLTIDTNQQQQEQQQQQQHTHGKPDPPTTNELFAVNTITSTTGTSTNPPSGRRIRSTRSKSAPSPSSSTSSGYRVLFSTPSKYDRWTILILSIPLAMIVVQMNALWIANATITNFERSSAVWCLGWTLIFVVLVYMLVLPKQVDIRSNGTIGIKTFLITYQFGDICHAYPAAFGRETIMGARYRFATCFSSQMVIRRRRGQWDVVVSPLQGEEFLQTLQSVITRLEIEGAGRTGSTIITTNNNNIHDDENDDVAPHDPPVSSLDNDLPVLVPPVV